MTFIWAVRKDGTMSKKARVYGLTGGVASGKSTVAGLFKELGCAVIDADEIAHQLTEKGEKAWQMIKDRFPATVFHADGTLDRKKLSDLIFSDAKQRQLLESILHPLILDSMRKSIRQLSMDHPIIIVEAALIFEGQYEKEFDGVMVVKCTEEQQVERLCRERGVGREKAIQIIRTQMPASEKIKKATFVIDNSKDLKTTRLEVKRVFDAI